MHTATVRGRGSGRQQRHPVNMAGQVSNNGGTVLYALHKARAAMGSGGQQRQAVAEYSAKILVRYVLHQARVTQGRGGSSVRRLSTMTDRLASGCVASMLRYYRNCVCYTKPG